MNTATALVVHRSSTNMAVAEKENLWAMAGAMIQAGIYPKKFKNQNEAYIVALCGHEMGLTPQRAWMELHLIQGQPAPRAHFQVTMAKTKIPGLIWRIKEHTAKICVIEHGLPGEATNLTDYTWDEAKAADLLSKDNWKNDLRGMLYCRAASRAVRWYYPETQSGLLHSVEELRDLVGPDSGIVENAGLERAVSGPGRMPKAGDHLVVGVDPGQGKEQAAVVIMDTETGKVVDTEQLGSEPSPAELPAEPQANPVNEAVQALGKLLVGADVNEGERRYGNWRQEHKGGDPATMIQGYELWEDWKRQKTVG